MREFTNRVATVAMTTLVATVATFSVMALATPALAETKPVEVVIGACDAVADKDPKKCGYSAGDNGDIAGCFKGGSCFYCPADGSRQCTMVRIGNVGPGLGGLGGLGGKRELAPPQSLSESAPAPSGPSAPPPGPGPIL